MRRPRHAATVIGVMAKAVKIPVTVKMRAGWDEHERNAPDVARMMEDSGAAAVAVHGRTAAQSYSGNADWDLVARVAELLSIPVFGSGDCIEPADIVDRLKLGVEGVLVGRGVLRNPWILSQAADLVAGRPVKVVSARDRGRFLLEYIELLKSERRREPEGFRHAAAGWPEAERAPHSTLEAQQGHDRWVVNKIRALATYFTKGHDNGSHLRTAVNSARSLAELYETIERFFFSSELVSS